MDYEVWLRAVVGEVVRLAPSDGWAAAWARQDDGSVTFSASAQTADLRMPATAELQRRPPPLGPMPRRTVTGSCFRVGEREYLSGRSPADMARAISDLARESIARAMRA